MTRADPIRAALERLLSDIQALSDSSQGIVGLHRNGDPAPWNELLEGGSYSSWLGDAIADARAALAEERGEGERRWTEGICGDGAAILFDGVMVPVHEVVRALNCHRSQPPAEGEVAELVEWLRENAEDERQMCESSNRASLNLERAAELLQQQHPTPVPVSERLPGPEEMDGSLVWCGSQAAGLPYWEWCLDDIRHPGSSGYTHWLPANTPALPTALPLTQGEVK